MTSTIVMLMAVAVAGLLFGIVIQARRTAGPVRRVKTDCGGDMSWMIASSYSGDAGSSDCSAGDGGGAGCDGGGGGGSD